MYINKWLFIYSFQQFANQLNLFYRKQIDSNRSKRVIECACTVHTYRIKGREPPTLFGLVDSLQASINFFNTNRHSRNVAKNGWCDSRHNDVSEWVRILERRRDARGEGEWLPPDSESALGAGIPKRGAVGPPTWWCCPGGSESRRLGQSRSESLGATLLL